MAITIPHLPEKLKLLISRTAPRNPNITRQKDLVDSLKLDSAGNISNWKTCSGVPEEHLPKLLELFGLEKEVLLLEDMEAFEAEITKALPSQSPPISEWEKLYQRAHRSGTPTETRGKVRIVDRGLTLVMAADDSSWEGKRLTDGDMFTLQLEGARGWEVVVLLQGPTSGIECLCPHADLGEYNNILTEADERGGGVWRQQYQAGPPYGQHYFVVVYLARPLSPFLRNCLTDSSGLMLHLALQQLNFELERGADAGFVLRLPFVVDRRGPTITAASAT